MGGDVNHSSLHWTGVNDANGQLSLNTMATQSWDLEFGDNADIECRNAQDDILEESFGRHGALWTFWRRDGEPARRSFAR